MTDIDIEIHHKQSPNQTAPSLFHIKAPLKPNGSRPHLITSTLHLRSAPDPQCDLQAVPPHLIFPLREYLPQLITHPTIRTPAFIFSPVIHAERSRFAPDLGLGRAAWRANFISLDLHYTPGSTQSSSSDRSFIFTPALRATVRSQLFVGAPCRRRLAADLRYSVSESRRRNKFVRCVHSSPLPR